MTPEKGPVESPSSTQPHPNRRRTRMKTLLALRGQRPPLTPEQVKHRVDTLVIARQARAIKRLARLLKAAPPVVEPPVPPQDGYRPPKGPSKARVEKPVIVTLQMRHTINGRAYGPGTVTLSPSKAQAFLHTEHEALAKEDSLNRQQAFIIGFRGGVVMRREVPAARFDDLLMREELPIHSTGGDR